MEHRIHLGRHLLPVGAKAGNELAGIGKNIFRVRNLNPILALLQFNLIDRVLHRRFALLKFRPRIGAVFAHFAYAAAPFQEFDEVSFGSVKSRLSFSAQFLRRLIQL